MYMVLGRVLPFRQVAEAASCDAESNKRRRRRSSMLLVMGKPRPESRLYGVTDGVIFLRNCYTRAVSNYCLEYHFIGCRWQGLRSWVCCCELLIL